MTLGALGGRIRCSGCRSVAQLGRASVSKTECRGFESCRSCQTLGFAFPLFPNYFYGRRPTSVCFFDLAAVCCVGKARGRYFLEKVAEKLLGEGIYPIILLWTW